MNVRAARPWLLSTLFAVALAACANGPFGGREGPGSEASSGSGSGATGATGAGGLNLPTYQNPCEQAGAPPECEAVPSGPACGDGQINQPSEVCDDGNSLPGDGCTGVCAVEPYFECPTPGAPCISTIVCGDGVLGPGEACDDGNTLGGDGCSATCNLVEPGFACRMPGAACIRVYLCGDGSVDPNEGCDDGNNLDGDGCDARCRLEPLYKCDGSPSVCSPTICGDGIREGSESCDDGNAIPFDGCSSECRAEPNCSAGACVSSCGDGIVLDEECDDGNLRDGDGCSSSCRVEPGYTCNNDAGVCELVADQCTLTVPAVFRDFNSSAAGASGHPDFQPPGDSQAAITGMVQAQLNAQGKPVYAGTNGSGFVQSAGSFAEWYTTSTRSATIVGSIVLWDNMMDGFVNRWGPNGEQWLGYANDAVYCGPGGTGCTDCTLAAGQICADPCVPWNSNQACAVTPLYFDGDPVFFPIDGHPAALQDERSLASIPPQYGGNWNNEPNGMPHNFHFTTEVHYWFEYDAATPTRLDFTGDDDVWVFVNRRLALDLGGWHPPLDGTVNINAAAGATYGLTTGNVYEIAIFHAERKTTGSSFRLTLSGFNLAPSDCVTDCGDGSLAPGEECDDGPLNQGGYDQCTPSCTLGPRCGDAIVQDQFAEVCDNGVNDGSYGGCAPTCQLGPHCGDGVVQPEYEQCDDAVNAGGYGACSPGCVLGPYCGDGVVTLGYEECDDANNTDSDGCSAACRLEIGVQR